jgi:hypothetical protein
MAQRFSIESNAIRIERDFVKAPIFQAQRTYRTLSRPAHDVKWLQFLVTYIPTSGKGKDIVWEDDLVVELNVLIPAKKGKGYGEVIMLSGEEVLSSVPGDGRAHYVLFQIPPAVLMKYSGFAAYNRDASEAVFAAVTFRRGNSRAVIATGYAEIKGRSVQDVARVFSGYYNSKIGVLKLDDAILPKEKTPWQWIDTDFFDPPKSMMEGKR